jgi:hypothetical protein
MKQSPQSHFLTSFLHDLSRVWDEKVHQLGIEVAHVQLAFGRLPHHRKSFRQQAIQGFPTPASIGSQPHFKFLRLHFELLVTELNELRLQLVDFLDSWQVPAKI